MAQRSSYVEACPVVFVGQRQQRKRRLMLLTLLRQLIKHKLDQAVAQNQVQMVSLQCQPSVNHCKTTGSSQAPMPSLCKMEGDSQAILLSIDLVHTRAQMASERQKLKHKVHWSSLSWVKPGQQGKTRLDKATLHQWVVMVASLVSWRCADQNNSLEGGLLESPPAGMHLNTRLKEYKLMLILSSSCTCNIREQVQLCIGRERFFKGRVLCTKK